MSGHTKGPWKVGDRVLDTGHLKVTAGISGLVAVVGNGDRVEARRSADARLIAAAPDLLEALEELLPRALNSDNAHISDDMVIPIDLTMGEIRKARAALDKARATEAQP